MYSSSSCSAWGERNPSVSGPILLKGPVVWIGFGVPDSTCIERNEKKSPLRLIHSAGTLLEMPESESSHTRSRMGLLGGTLGQCDVTLAMAFSLSAKYEIYRHGARYGQAQVFARLHICDGANLSRNLSGARVWPVWSVEEGTCLAQGTLFGKRGRPNLGGIMTGSPPSTKGTLMSSVYSVVLLVLPNGPWTSSSWEGASNLGVGWLPEGGNERVKMAYSIFRQAKAWP